MSNDRSNSTPNTESTNTGSTNTGSTNTGSTNTGSTNTGSTNTGSTSRPTVRLDDRQAPVLIVDDNQQYAQVLKRILEQGFGYLNVSHVADTESGFEQIRSQPRHFVLLFVDYRFAGGGTGVELLQRLDREGLMQGLVAFLITSEPTPENQRAATEAGALGVVAKPFDRAELGRQLEKARRAFEVESKESF